VNARQPSASSRTKFGACIVAAAAGIRIAASRRTLTPNVVASSAIAQPEPIVATSAPPAAAPTT
jgi:hypothetical protein